MIRDDGRTIKSITSQGVLGKPVWASTWRRMSRMPPLDMQPKCSIDSLRGTWTNFASYSLVMVSQPDAPQPVPVPHAVVGVARKLWRRNRLGGDRGRLGDGVVEKFAILEGWQELKAIATQGSLGKPVGIETGYKPSNVPNQAQW